MKRKPSFTIIELIIVIVLLGLVFMMTRNYFSSENQIYYQGEICINNAYYMLKDLNNAALLGRTRALSGTFFSSGNDIQSPDWYQVVLRAPSYYEPPQFTFSVEDTTGLIRELNKNPLSGGILGTFGGQNINSTNLASWFYLYRGTGQVSADIDTGASTFGIFYMPIWGLNYMLTAGSGGYQPIPGCTSKNYFVTYTIPSPYANESALRIGFQNSASINAKKMIIYHTQWYSGSYIEANTGAINFQVCNNADLCKETFRIFFDSRVDDLFLQKCKTFDSNRRCIDWQGGDIN